MEFSELVSTAFEALTINKLRTVLATLGIVIGIGAVITLISLGQAGQASVDQQIQSLGSNLLTVIPGATTTGAVRGAAGGATNLTYNDAKAIMNSSRVTDVANVSPELASRKQVSAGRNNSNVQVIGVTPAYVQVHNVSMAAGTFISQGNVDGMGRVAVIGPQVASDLYGSGSTPVGQMIRISNMTFKIIGVTVSKGGSGFLNQDNIVFIPLTTAQVQITGENYLSSIAIEAKSAKVMTAAENQVGYLLLSRHHISSPANADFNILSQADVLGAASQITGTFTALLSGIAAISLLVGGIGIMNIMLVTVIERTREIGLRKALGAKKNIIIYQFLAEAIILTFTGGFLGMILGIVLSFIIASLIHLPFVLSVSGVVLAIGVSGIIGVLFGWYPARQAANLRPIEALRYE